MELESTLITCVALIEYGNKHKSFQNKAIMIAQDLIGLLSKSDYLKAQAAINLAAGERIV